MDSIKPIKKQWNEALHGEMPYTEFLANYFSTKGQIVYWHEQNSMWFG